MMTNADLANLEKAYASGVLEVREGDTWVKYQGMKDMRLAIIEAKKEQSATAPRGARVMSSGNGY